MNVVKLPAPACADGDARTRDQARRCAEGEGIVDEMQPLIPPGTYLMRYVDHRTVLMFGRQPKVVVRLDICTNGFVGTRVERWYNAKALIGKPARYGRFHAGRSSNLVREYAGIFDLPRRFDRIALTKLEGLLLSGVVDTVTTDHQQRPLPKSVHYSVVKTIGRASI